MLNNGLKLSSSVSLPRTFLLTLREITLYGMV